MRVPAQLAIKHGTYRNEVGRNLNVPAHRVHSPERIGIRADEAELFASAKQVGRRFRAQACKEVGSAGTGRSILTGIAERRCPI